MAMLTLILAVSLSGKCRDDRNCYSSKFCNQKNRCRNRLSLGEECDLRETGCQLPFICSAPPGSEIATCREQQCSESSSCSHSERCFSGICYNSLQEDDSCFDYPDGCSHNLICTTLQDRKSKACKPVPCIGPNDCPINGYCSDTNNTCVASALPGESCDPDIDNCSEETHCVNTSSAGFRCHEIPCDSNGDCRGFRYLKCTNKKCITQRVAQDSCKVNSDCTGYDTYPNTVCLDNFCLKRRLTLGDDCWGVHASPPCLSTLTCASKKQNESRCEHLRTYAPVALPLGVACDIKNNHCHSAYECVQVEKYGYRCQVTPILLHEVCDPNSHIKCAYPHSCLRYTNNTYRCNDYIIEGDVCSVGGIPCKDPIECLSNGTDSHNCRLPSFVEKNDICKINSIPCRPPYVCQQFSESDYSCSELYVAEDEGCDPNGRHCVFPLVCQQDSANSYTCTVKDKPPIELGAPCQLGSTPCEVPYTCALASGVGYVCSNIRSPLDVMFLPRGSQCKTGGQPCEIPFVCRPSANIFICGLQIEGGNCHPLGTVCDEQFECKLHEGSVHHVCVYRNKSPLGKSCEVGFKSCESPAICEQTAKGDVGYCKLALNLGDLCTTDSQCSDGYKCLQSAIGFDDGYNSTEHRCSPPRCYSTGDCPQALRCDVVLGDCVPRKSVLQPCNPVAVRSGCEEHLKCMPMDDAPKQGFCMEQLCSTDGYCEYQSKQYCDTELHICKIRSSYNYTECDTDSDCDEKNNVCRWGYCSYQKQLLDQHCDIRSVCASSLACLGPTTSRSCGKAPTQLSFCDGLFCQEGLSCINDICTTPILVKCSDGDLVDLDCNTCVCRFGWWRCTALVCTSCTSTLSDCPEDQFCKLSQKIDSITNDLLCGASNDKVCSPRLGVNESCGAVGNELCRFGSCKSGLKCISAPLNPLVRGTCQNEFLHEGESCRYGTALKRTMIDRSNDCLPGLHCVDSICQKQTTHSPSPLVLQSECSSDANCSAEHYCGSSLLATGTCSKDESCLPFASFGEFCTGLTCGDRPCESSLQCSSNTGGGIVALTPLKCLQVLKIHDICRRDKQLFDRSSDCPRGTECKMIAQGLYGCEEPVVVVNPLPVTEKYCMSDADCSSTETCTPQVLQYTGVKMCSSTKTCIPRSRLNEKCETQGDLPCFYKMCMSNPGDELFCSAETKTCLQAFLFIGDNCVGREKSCPVKTTCVDGICQLKVTNVVVVEDPRLPFCSASGQCPSQQGLECEIGECSPSPYTEKCLDFRNPPKTDAARSYCCTYHKVFCHSYSSTNSTSTCKIPIEHMPYSQQVHCCNTFQMACPIPKYDCQVSSIETNFTLTSSRYVESTKSWSPAKKQSCCSLKGIGCDFINCNRYTIHENGWQGKVCASQQSLKQRNSALKINKNMPSLNMACYVGSDEINSWSPLKMKYCCLHENVGCSVDCNADLASLTSTQRSQCCSSRGVYCSEKTFISSIIPQPNYRLIINGFIEDIRTEPKRFLRKLLLLLSSSIPEHSRLLQSLSPVTFAPYNASENIRLEYGVKIPATWVTEAYEEMSEYNKLNLSDHKGAVKIPFGSVTEDEEITNPKPEKINNQTKIYIDLTISERFVLPVKNSLLMTAAAVELNRNDLLRVQGATLLKLDTALQNTNSPQNLPPVTESPEPESQTPSPSKKDKFWSLALIVSSSLCCLVLCVVGIYLLKTRKKSDKQPTELSLLEMESKDEPDLIIAE